MVKGLNSGRDRPESGRGNRTAAAGESRMTRERTA